jgi:hypothetical protein
MCGARVAGEGDDAIDGDHQERDEKSKVSAQRTPKTTTPMIPSCSQIKSSHARHARAVVSHPPAFFERIEGAIQTIQYPEPSP